MTALLVLLLADSAESEIKKFLIKEKEFTKMLARKLFIVFALLLFASLVSGGMVYVNYTERGKMGDCYYEEEVKPHEDFVFNLDFPEPAVVSRVWYKKISPQIAIKHRLICVGIDEFKGKSYAYDNKACSWDANYISKQNYYIFGGTGVLLTNTFATKEVIRQKISEYAEVLASGESFLFYYAGRAEKGSALLAYDAEYSVSEFVEDLGKFAKGVKIVLILDAVWVDEFVKALPANLISNSDVLLIACTRNSLKKCKGRLGPFMKAWANSIHKYLTDLNQDKYLSFYEITKRVQAYLKVHKFKERFFFKNEELARELIYDGAYSVECYGDIEFDLEKRTFSFTMPDIDGDAQVLIEAQSSSYYEDLKIYPSQGSFNVNLKKNPPTTKIALDFVSEFSLVDDPNQTYSLRLNKVHIPLVGEVKMKKDGSSGIFFLQDRAFKNIGKLKFQYADGKFFYKLLLTDKERLSEVLEQSSGTETVDLLIRHSWNIGPPQKLTYEKTYKPGKSLNAKLQVE